MPMIDVANINSFLQMPPYSFVGSLIVFVVSEQTYLPKAYTPWRLSS